MSYHSELDVAQRPSDDALAAAEKRGARAALTRLAAWAHEAGLHEMGTHTKRFQQAQYPAPRVRAVVRDDYDVEWRLHGDEWKSFVGDVIPYQGEYPTRAAVAGMFEAQQRADAEGLVSAEEDADSQRCKGAPADSTGASRESGFPAAPSPQSGAGAVEAGSAPLPPTREWWLNVYNGDDSAFAYPSREAADRAASVTREELVRVRELRPLTAAQVEALGKTIGDAITIHRDDFVLEARAALAHLGIPYETEEVQS